MVIPKHIRNVSPEDRQAVAPYNFVELPNKVVPAESLLSSDRYHPDRYTGKIECILTTESPIYIRCGLTPADFTKFGEESTSVEDLDQLTPEERVRRTNFFQSPDTNVPLIPGSSLRGMLRALLEIASFSKIDRVSNEQRFFFRTVAGNPTTDSVAKEYKDYVNTENIQAGYLKSDGENWYICPAKSIKDVTFAWVRENSLSLPNFKKFDDSLYHPQYISVSFSTVDRDNEDRAKRFFAQDVNISETNEHKGILVTSGNMKLADKASPRRNHCLVFEIDSKAKRLKIDKVAVQHYRNALTDFQKESPFSKETGVLKEDRPVFYISPEEGDVGFFGQSPNFRIPYSPDKNGHASTVWDFIPETLRDSSVIDIADAIFGYVERDKQKTKKEKSCAGRVFFSDAKTEDTDTYLRAIKPKILGSPKPTNFQNYLVQPEETSADKANLKHYASKPMRRNDSGDDFSGDTVIRGHKLYWHKGVVQVEQIQETDQGKISKARSQYTKIKPIKPGISFKFTIYFENLSKVELGAILWVLDIAQDDEYRLSLGMGKPLGMGAVKIEHKLYLSNRQQRYEQLFEGQDWAIAESSNIDNELVLSMEPMANQLKDTPRIKMLLAMLSWKETLSQDELNQRRYMEIARDVNEPHIIGTPRGNFNTHNEYKDRPVLPTPLQIMELDNNRRVNHSLNSKETGFIRAFETYILDGISDSPPPPPKFTLGQIVEAKVAKLSTKEVEAKKKTKTTLIYEVDGERLAKQEEIYDMEKKGISLNEGDIVMLKIIELNLDGNIKKYERLDSTESASTSSR